MLPAAHLIADQMKRHVLDLCEHHEIQIEWSTRKAWSAHDLQLVHIPPIKSSISYAVALHEIGHVLGRH